MKINTYIWFYLAIKNMAINGEEMNSQLLQEYMEQSEKNDFIKVYCYNDSNYDDSSYSESHSDSYSEYSD